MKSPRFYKVLSARMSFGLSLIWLFLAQKTAALEKRADESVQ
ncbi:hypothetical protein P9D36_07155 [Bacillus haynesii]|nr:hypothetical protein [Bacillus haynesii]MEC0670758.1 hypothetical protein [Bacillus haynesii]MEC1346711.1 hypothetical protein [Bacillus haynesii]MEC1418468.1 hypothetical protein [Bacillus haynesii]MEC1447133.1 hypothetical protein [Bacillus haynesii]MEC1469865.1 hypothetical protein [Bacillus haynesii]